MNDVYSAATAPRRGATAFADYSPWAARGVLASAAALLIVCVAIPLSPWKTGYAERARFQAPSDIDLYNAEVGRMRQGEGYYQAAAAELRARGYPTKSVFNWRTPLPMWLIAHLPRGFGQAVIGLLGVFLVAATFLILAREGSLRLAALGAVLQFGAIMPCFLGELYVMPMLWAAVLMGLSLSAYGFGRWKLGLACGLAALFCRDLAGPYCALAALLAVRQRCWKEVACWGAGMAAYGAFFAVHWSIVRSLALPGDVAHMQGWVQFGGLPFLISTAQMNSYLLVLPQWAAGAYLVLALLGLAGWQSKAGERFALTAVGYLLLFAMVGQDFNQYWGALVMPLYCFGAARTWPALADLWRAARLAPIRAGGTEKLRAEK